MPCRDDCDWNMTSGLRLCFEQPDSETFFSPTRVPVDYCRRCGAIRLRPDTVAALAIAERREQQRKTNVLGP